MVDVDFLQSFLSLNFDDPPVKIYVSHFVRQMLCGQVSGEMSRCQLDSIDLPTSTFPCPTIIHTIHLHWKPVGPSLPFPSSTSPLPIIHTFVHFPPSIHSTIIHTNIFEDYSQH